MHRGHQKIIRTALEWTELNAKSQPTESILFTFHPHPRVVLGFDLNLICSYEERRRILQATDMSLILEQEFDSSFQRMEAEIFVREVLHARLKASAVVVGENFRFGYQARGDVSLLENMNLFRTVRVSPEKEGDRPVSSSWIRDCLRSRDVKLAERLLGRPFAVSGLVVKGDQRGRLLGFPTANIRVDLQLLIPRGVFLVTVEGVTSDPWPAVCNVGVRPSFEGVGTWIECHLLNFDGDLYGKTLTVHFLDFIREEKKFSSIDDLKLQISKDVAKGETLSVDLGLPQRRHS